MQTVSMLQTTMSGDVFDDIAIAEEFSQLFANCNPSVHVRTTNRDSKGQPSIWTEVC